MHLIGGGEFLIIAAFLLQLAVEPRSRQLAKTKARADTPRRNVPLFALVLASLAGFAPGANAVPSMARQTGYECARCHTVFPELTRFGRQFKLGAYAGSSQKWDARPLLERVPIAAAVQISQTNTNNTTAGGAMPSDFPRDRELLLQTLALYYGGQITQNSGALVQYNYDGVERRWGMEMFDARYAKGFSVGDKEVTVGVTLNNSPTVSDIYNSTPSWSFPHTDSVAPAMPASTVIDMMLASQVGGVTVYGMWNDLIYAEAGVYRTAARGALRILGHGVPTDTVLTGNNPYWRLALQRESGKHSVEVGTYGMRAKIQLDSADATAGTNLFEDYALDASYQYINGDHAFSTHATWIHETQRWNAGFASGLTSNASDSLTTFRADWHYFFRRKVGGILQYFRTSGSGDALLYDTGDAVMGSTHGNPDSRGWVGEVNYLPADRIKLAVRYTVFERFNGASRDYVPGRNASNNDNVFFLAWILF